MWMLLYNFYCLTSLFFLFVCMFRVGWVGFLFFFVQKQKNLEGLLMLQLHFTFSCVSFNKNSWKYDSEVGFSGSSMLSETPIRVGMSDWKSELFWEPRVCDSIQLLRVSALSETITGITRFVCVIALTVLCNVYLYACCYVGFRCTP